METTTTTTTTTTDSPEQSQIHTDTQSTRKYTVAVAAKVAAAALNRVLDDIGRVVIVNFTPYNLNKTITGCKPICYAIGFSALSVFERKFAV